MLNIHPMSKTITFSAFVFIAKNLFYTSEIQHLF